MAILFHSNIAFVSVVYIVLVCENSFSHTKAAAWAKPRQSQAVSGGFGLA